MRVLERVPLFAGVAKATLEHLHARLIRRRYAAGELILRAGAESSALYGVIEGAVRVELGTDNGRRLLLVAPQCFGELSVLTGEPVSATVVAHRDTEVWMLATDALMAAIEGEDQFFRNLAEMLGQRLRHRTRVQRSMHTRVILLPLADERDALLAAHLAAGIAHYLPGSVRLDAPGDDAGATERALAAAVDAATGDTAVLLLAGRTAAEALAAVLHPTDALLMRGATPALPGPAEPIEYRWADEEAGALDGPWRHQIDAGQIGAAPQAPAQRPGNPALDRLVRRLCGREVGVAMSVGVAAGFAHLGLLEALDDADVPIDYLCGSSMGGAVALAYARFGRARDAIAAMTRLAADFARDRGITLMPRASLVAADRMVTITNELFGRETFARLGRPAAVVAADLVAGRRVVLDRGPVADAARATIAIPGLFAPVRLGNAMLVDGGVVSRVPADLLIARGCGCKLASWVHPDQPQHADHGKAADDLERRLDQPLGLRAALGGAWRLLGWWDSAAQAARADLALRIPTPPTESFNFAYAERFVDCGRRAAQRQIGAIRAAAQRTLQPGVP